MGQCVGGVQIFRTIKREKIRRFLREDRLGIGRWYGNLQFGAELLGVKFAFFGKWISMETGSVFRANVIATDLPEQLPLLERNREFNTRNFKGSVKVLPLTWGNAADIDRLKSERFDWILIIDCLYYEMV